MTITVYLIISTVIISIIGFRRSIVINKLIFSPYRVFRDKEFPRFITSGFIHNDYLHLIFNMFSLYSFGQNVEATYEYYYGSKSNGLFLLLYLGGIFVSNIPAFLKNKRNPNFFSLGASGGVSAIIATSILYYPNSPICILGLFCLPSLMLGLIYVIYVMYLNTSRIYSRTDHIAHITGAIYGILFNIILEPKVLPFFYHQMKGFKLF